MDLSYQEKLNLISTIRRQLVELKDKASSLKNESIDILKENPISDGRGHFINELAGGLSAGVAVILLLIVCCIRRKRRRRWRVNQG